MDSDVDDGLSNDDAQSALSDLVGEARDLQQALSGVDARPEPQEDSPQPR